VATDSRFVPRTSLDDFTAAAAAAAAALGAMQTGGMDEAKLASRYFPFGRPHQASPGYHYLNVKANHVNFGLWLW